MFGPENEATRSHPPQVKRLSGTEDDRFRIAIEASPDGFLLVGPDGRILETNQSYLDRSGYSREELLTKSVLDIEAVDSAEEIAARIAQSISDGHAQFESLHRSKDGSVWPVQVTLTYRPIEDGLFFCFLKDITQQMHSRFWERIRHEVVTPLVNGQPLEQVMEAIAHCVELEVPGSKCIVAVYGSTVDSEMASQLHAQMMESEYGFHIQHPIIAASEKPLGLIRLYFSRPNPVLCRENWILENAANIAAIAVERGQFEGRARIASLVFEHSTDGILVTDNLNRIVAVNPAFEKLTGYSLEEIRGCNPRHFRSGIHDPAFFDAMWADIHSTGRWQGEIWDRRKDGKISIKWLTIGVFHSKTGEVEGYIGIFSDITTTKSAQVLLRENQAYMSAIISNLPGAAFQILETSSGRLHLCFISEGSSALLGYSNEYLQQNPDVFFQLVHTEDRESFFGHMAESALAMTPCNWEGRIVCPADDTEKWVNFRGSPRVVSQGVLWDGVIFNITQSKQHMLEIERSRHQLEQLSSHIVEAREEERIEVAHKIHDDLGSKLTAAKLGIAWLVAHMEGVDSRIAEKLADAEALLDSCTAIANEILHDLHPPLLDNFGIVAAIESEAAQFWRRTDIACEVESEDWGVEPGRRMALTAYRIFQEALNNVMKHARARTVKVRVNNQQTRLTLSVTDDGVGFSEEAGNKSSRFGLIGIRERVRHFDGFVHIDSSPGRGTTVAIELPLRPAKELP
jgi:two-component system sensor histidine kinase UhpB